MPITLNGDTGIQTPMYNGTITANAVTPSVNMKNRIINGAMVIDQRNAGATVTPANQAYTLDRWSAFTNGTGVYTVGQSSIAPANYKNSLLCTVTTADSSVTGSDYYMLQQRIEGFNTADLNWGGANAQTVCLSFWVRSSITGTYTVKLGNADSDRSYVATYTISSANTWEQKSITITGDTTGTWATTNSTGIEIRFGLALGSSWTTSTVNAWQTGNFFGATTASNNWISTNGATFYITGVQLEVGSTATSFDYRPYGTELALCQRYYAVTSAVLYGSISGAAGQGAVNWFYKTTMRTAPTVTGNAATTVVTSTADFAAGLTNNTGGYYASFASGSTASAEL